MPLIFGLINIEGGFMKALFLFGIMFFAFSLAISCSKQMSEKDYFDRANQYMGQQNWEKAEESFAAIYENFPNGVFSSKALFMVAYINANHLNNLEKARTYYTEFLEKYPEHELSDDAQYELDHLGKDVDDLPFISSERAEEEDSTIEVQQEVSSSN